MIDKKDRAISYIEVLFSMFILVLISLLLVRTFFSEKKISDGMAYRTEALEDMDIIIEYINSKEQGSFIYKGLDLLNIKKELLECDENTFIYDIEGSKLQVKKLVLDDDNYINRLIKLKFDYTYKANKNIELVIIVEER